MPRKTPVAVPSSTSERICCFCGLGDVNELEYGKIHEYNGIITHYYCLLLSSNMQQRGRDDEGILGFLPDDINKELRRGKKLACCYCKKIGATLGCCNTKCKKIFHFPCGLKAGSLHQFFGEFRSYCRNHRPKQKIDSHVEKEISQHDNKICYICYDAVNAHDMLGTLWAPCCKKNAWFHRTCVQQLAMSAGYFFKCPLCNNKIEFQKAMLNYGIFIPSQDASWELVPNAFEELLYRHNRCDAKKCMCPKGRAHTSPNAKWELTLCRTCGSQGIHMACGNLKWAKPAWECHECTSILNKSVKAGSSKKSKILRSSARFHEQSRDDGSITDDDDDDDGDDNNDNDDDDDDDNDDDDDDCNDSSSSNSDISVGGLPEMPMEATFSTASISTSLSLETISKDQEKNMGNKLVTNHDKPNGIIENSRKVSIAMSNDETIQFNEELPPLTKKPRISDSDDSDDDIIVLSGPSSKEGPKTNGLESSVKVQRSLEHSWGFVTTPNVDKNLKQITEKEPQAETRNVEKPSRFSMDSLSKARVTSRVTSEIERRVPVEIDLSDSEVIVTDNPSMIVTSESTSNIPTDTPEWNIKITNVTSLAPEVFASVPELETQSESDSVIGQSSTSQINKIQQNNQNYGSQQTHEHMQIVRLDSTGTNANIPPNSVLYGLTIPGTNNTVPFILSPIEPSTTSQAPPTLQNIWNKSVLNRSLLSNHATTTSTPPIRPAPGPKSRKAERTARAERAARAASAVTAVKNAETQIADTPKIPTSPLCYSVPLEAVVNETIAINRPSSKTKNSIDSGTFAKTQGPGSIKSKKKIESSSKASVSTSTSVGSLSLLKSTNSMASVDKTVKNGVNPSSVPQIYGFTQTESSSIPQTSLNTPNGLVTPRISQTEPKNSFPQDQANAQASIENKNPSSSNTNGNNSGTGYKSSENLQLKKSKNIDNEMGLYIIPTDENTQGSSENCDGDAGSGPAVQPTSANATNAKPKRSRNVPTSPCQLVAASDNRDRSTIDKTRIDAKIETENHFTSECPSVRNWVNCNSSNRTGLMEKMINLRDLKFTVCGSNIVKMTMYETYSVNINVGTSNRCNYTSCRSSEILEENSADINAKKTIRSSRIRENYFSRNVDSDSENLPGSMTRVFETDSIDNDDNAVLNESENKSQGNLPITDKINPTNELSRTEVNSRGEDELKENLDPIPASTNLINNNSTSSIDRKNKNRLRTGVNNHTMQLLNETHETISEGNDKSPRKLGNHDSLLVANPTKIAFNGWKENSSRTLVATSEDEAQSQTISANRGVESGVKNTAKRRNLMDENATGEISVQAKRPKYLNDENSFESQDCEKIVATEEPNSDTSTTVNHLVNNAEKSQNRKSLRGHQAEHSNMNNISHDRKKTRVEQANSKDSPCCKVSIDLTRIRSILATKLHTETSKLEDCESYERTDETCANKKSDEKYDFHLKLIKTDLSTRSRSLDNLTNFDNSSMEQSSVVEFRKWKSLENLWSISLRDIYVNNPDGSHISTVENNRRGCKRKTRSFEKHDCVR